LADGLSAYLLRATFSVPIRGKFVAWHRRVPFSSAIQNPQGFRTISPTSALAEILFSTHSGNLFRYSNIDELIKSHPFRFGHLARLLHQGGL
jgi:hypothetical protein